MTETEKKKRSFSWSFWLLPSVIFIVLMVFSRQTVFRFAGYDLSKPDYWIPILVGAFCLLVAWWGLLRKSRPKPIRVAAKSVFGLVVLCIIYVLVSPIPWVRFQFFRYETLHGNLGVTHREEGLREELEDELLKPGTGPRIARDPELLRVLVLEHGEEFRGEPRSAQVAYAGLRVDGMTFDEVLNQHGAKEFLSAVLHSEANTSAWFGLDDYPRPDLEPDPNHGFYAGLLTREQAQKVVIHERSLDREDSLDHTAFFFVNFPTLFDDVARENLEAQWIGRFPEMEEYAELGFRLIDELRNTVGENSPATVAISATPERYLRPSEWERNRMKPTIEQTLLGLVRMIAPNVELVEDGDADLQLKAVAGLSHTFDRVVPVYVGETVRVPAGRRYVGRGVGLTTYRKEYRTKQVGTRTEGVLDASIILEIGGGEEPIVIGEELYYWYDAIVAAKKNSGADANGQRVDWRRLYGLYGKRIWPIGLKEDMFHFDGPVEEIVYSEDLSDE